MWDGDLRQPCIGLKSHVYTTSELYYKMLLNSEATLHYSDKFYLVMYCYCSILRDLHC